METSGLLRYEEEEEEMKTFLLHSMHHREPGKARKEMEVKEEEAERKEECGRKKMEKERKKTRGNVPCSVSLAGLGTTEKTKGGRRGEERRVLINGCRR